MTKVSQELAQAAIEQVMAMPETTIRTKDGVYVRFDSIQLSLGFSSGESSAVFKQGDEKMTEVSLDMAKVTGVQLNDVQITINIPKAFFQIWETPE